MNTPLAPQPMDDDPIEDAAALWQVRRAEGLSAEELREFEAWLRADRRHADALARLEQTQVLLERLPFAADRLSDLRPAAPAPSAVYYRRPAPPSTLPAWTALAAAVVVALIAWWQWPAARPDALHYATSTGGYERVLLADGSTLELNAASAARVELTPTERRVTLTAGEAHFKVAHDPERPFVVSAGTYRVRAVGTAFNVRLNPTAVEVLVTEGKVLVGEQSADPMPAQPTNDKPLLSAGQRVVIASGERPSSTLVEDVPAATIRQTLSWQERKLQFMDTPLRQVVAQFNARNRTQLVLAGDDLGSRPVGGTFAADNVFAFVRLLESSGDIRVEQRAENEIVLHKAR